MSDSIINFYGRRIGRPLKQLHKDLCETLLPKYSFKSAKIIPKELFPACKKQALEIGYGTGDHLFAQASQKPNVGFIGCEPYMSGVVQLLKVLKNHPLENLRLSTDPIELLLPKFPTSCFDDIYILFPDPWPKKRHHKRRLVCKEKLELLADYLKSSGTITIATDHANYQEWMEETFENLETLELASKEELRLYDRPAHWPSTRFERKAAKEGRTSYVYKLVLRS